MRMKPGVKTSIGLLFSVTVAISGCGGGDDASTNQTSVSLNTISSRPDTVTEGSTLVQITLSDDTALANLKVTAGSADVTSAFAKRADGRILGLVTGLPAGPTVLTASVAGSTATASLTVKNYASGPIFSGPYQSPWVCQTASFRLPDGTNLGPSTAPLCAAPTQVQYVYSSSNAGGAFKPLPSTSSIPTDASTTTTSDGRVVNYIVRVETGVLNRAIYQFAVLHDPTKDPAPSPFVALPAWNNKLVFTFGGGAQSGYIQGTYTGGVLLPVMLSKGYAVVSSTLNVFANTSNDVLSAETASMVKERFIKTYGSPRFTIGYGPSGGAMSQHLIANNYPGILDGILPIASYPDLLSVIPPATDCSLLDRAFAGSTQTWTDAEKTAASGYASWGTCDGGAAGIAFPGNDWLHSFSPAWIVATRIVNNFPNIGVDLSNCYLVVPDGLVYNPTSNPTGARCDIYTAEKHLLGIDSATGFARRLIDNVGVQYGLSAFQGGQISAEKFVQLNELAGGYDVDGKLQPGRSSASPEGLTAAYEGGRINEGLNLANIPIIDYRPYLDLVPNIHDRVRSLMMRARLEKNTGTSQNQVILTGAVTDAIVLQKMDQWLTAIKADASNASTSAKVIANKPVDLVDACYSNSGVKIAEVASFSSVAQCNILYPVHTNPRIVAGSPLTDDVLKCQLRPISRTDYAQPLTDAQFARLSTVFSTGVCDYTKPGVGQNALKGTWFAYPSPGVYAPL